MIYFCGYFLEQLIKLVLLFVGFLVSNCNRGFLKVDDPKL